MWSAGRGNYNNCRLSLHASQKKGRHVIAVVQMKGNSGRAGNRTNTSSLSDSGSPGSPARQHEQDRWPFAMNCALVNHTIASTSALPQLTRSVKAFSSESATLCLQHSAMARDLALLWTLLFYVLRWLQPLLLLLCPPPQYSCI